MVLVGFLLAISVSIFLASLGIIITSTTGIIRENIITGSVIGTTGIISYSIITLIISLITSFILILILKNKKVK